VALDEAALTGLHPALAGRVVQLALGGVREDRRGASHRLVAAVLALAGQPTGRQVELPGGGTARAERGRIVLRPPLQPTPPPVTLTPPARVAWGRLGHLAARHLTGAEVPARPAAACGPRRALLDPERAAGPLQVRGVHPGDRFHPLGGPGERLLADFLRDAGVAAPDRATVPLVICAGRIAWVAGHRIDERYRLAENADAALELVWEPAS
jgi:tRNA(Ile)-lysidine synthase